MLEKIYPQRVIHIQFFSPLVEETLLKCCGTKAHHYTLLFDGVTQ